jgi:hypothetical protein
VLAEAGKPTPTPIEPGVLTLLHSGIVYPKERDPTPLFAALRRLSDAGHIRADTFRIRFRAAVHDTLLRGLAREHGVEAFIETCPPVSYEDALQEMRCADALLVIQASDCNEQIPGKLYEYLRAGRPILCLSDSRGDTVALLQAAGVNSIAAIDVPDEVPLRIAEFLAAVREGRADLPTQDAVQSASRRGRARVLARHLDEVAA